MRRILITGDTHRNFSHLKGYNDEPTVMIILGDAGINYCLDQRDADFKRSLARKFNNITFLCVRGNHEERPSNLDMVIKDITTQEFTGTFYIEPEFPNILYFIDGCYYNIGGRSIFVMGGAYSVDKYYRLAMGYKWFPEEQMNEMERIQMTSLFDHGYPVDMIFTHTCPYTWQPFDLFLAGIDQSTVDHTMEEFFQEMLDMERARGIQMFNTWCFGHFHSDRICGDGRGVMLSNKVITLDDAYKGIIREAWYNYATEE